MTDTEERALAARAEIYHKLANALADALADTVAAIERELPNTPNVAQLKEQAAKAKRMLVTQT
jgi:hypothetical protein